MSVAAEDDSLDPSEEDKQLYGRALSFFADEHDARLLIARLNADSEIAFIVPDGPRPSLLSRLLNTGHRQRWKAVQTADALADGAHILWQVPAGALPLLGVEGPSTLGPPSDPPIPDPWAGWIEERRGADLQIPYFGPNCPASIFLELWTRHRPYTLVERTTVSPVVTYWTQGYDVLVASGLQWGFGHWRPPPPQTLRWWNLLEIWMSQNALKLQDPIDPGVVLLGVPLRAAETQKWNALRGSRLEPGRIYSRSRNPDAQAALTACASRVQVPQIPILDNLFPNNSASQPCPFGCRQSWVWCSRTQARAETRH